MRKNPYSPTFKTRKGDPLPENLRFRGQDTPAIAASGDFNASNKKDLMAQIGNLISSYASGDIQRGRSQEESRLVATERRAILQEARQNPETWAALGAVMAEDISETTFREGFVRKFMLFSDLGQGDIARARFKVKEVIALIATAPTEVTPTYVRNNWKFLPEIYIGDRILIEERDIGQSTGDILEEKYQEGLEAIMVQEDRLWKQMADTAAGIYNTITYFTTFTPAIFSQIRSQVTGWGIPGAYCLMAYDLWDDIIGTTGFSDWFSPVEKHELVLEGQLGVMLGLQLLTDAFRLPELKVLTPGDVYIIGAPETHGVLMQRGDMSSNPITSYDLGKPERGWYIFEILAMSIIGAKSVSAGKRS